MNLRHLRTTQNLMGFDLETELLRRAVEKNGAPYPPEDVKQ